LEISEKNTYQSLLPLFCPKSIAVVGASRNPKSIGYRLLEAIVTNKFNGTVYPVNPSAKFIYSIRAYPEIAVCPEKIDLAIISVPALIVPQAIDNCIKADVKAIILISAGFAETGKEGKVLQNEILNRVREKGIRMVGPNCMGMLNASPDISMNASFSITLPPFGNVAMSSQSGALGLAVITHAKKLNIGLSSFVSVGNKADISANDLLHYWENDSDTKVILLYIESFGNPRKFVKLARRIGKNKPVLAVKSGRTKSGIRAAGSHTASLASNEIAVEALFNQTGVIRANTLEEMFDITAILSNQPLPLNNKVGVITNAGGLAILCADACESENLVLPEFSETIKSKLRTFLPAEAAISNPVDMVASATPESYYKAIKTIMASDEIDSLIILHIPVDDSDSDKFFNSINSAVSETRNTPEGKNKPVVGCLMYDENFLKSILSSSKMPLYRFPESAGRSLAKVVKYSAWKNKPLGVLRDFKDTHIENARKICLNALHERGKGWLKAKEIHELFSAFSISLPESGITTNEFSAAEIARKMGFPVVLKLSSHTIIHKTEVGGVYLNLNNEQEVIEAFLHLKQKMALLNKSDEMDGVLIQKMLMDPVEVMIGMVEDNTFGPIVAFGMGGIHVEVISDICFRITPLNDLDAKEMIRSIKGFKLLSGYRGHPAADIPALEELLLRISKLVEEIPEIKELDLNPVFALAPGKGCVIGDARIFVSDKLSIT